MRKISYKPYAFLALLLFVMLSMPYKSSEKIRSGAIAAVSPAWCSLNSLKDSFFKITTILPSRGFALSPTQELEIERLRQENQNLHTQLEMVRAHLTSEEAIREKLAIIQASDTSSPFFHKKIGELFRLIDFQAHSVLGKVIFREPASWSSSFWINIGECNNEALGKRIVAKNSPVVVGTTVVGVVEYVGQNRSRVRLVTDSGLVPSVRVARGAEQNRTLIEQIDALRLTLTLRSDVGVAPQVLKTLAQLREGLHVEEGSLYLAKGEIYGSSQPLWRSRGLLLHGVGFNYDFADEEGPARHLHTGEPLDMMSSSTKRGGVPLVKVGDLLVTTGMDGVFPAGLKVAQVVHVYPLREGAPSFDLEAKTLVTNLDSLTYVTVLPPVES